jgi:hypothetical protein
MEASKGNKKLENDFAQWVCEANIMLKSCLRIENSEQNLRTLSKSAFFAGAESKRMQMVEDLAAIMMQNLNFIQKQSLDPEKGVPTKEFIAFYESLQEGLQSTLRKVALEDIDPSSK